MPTIPQPLVQLGAAVVILFLVAMIVWLILQIIKAVKGFSAEKATVQCGPEATGRRLPSCYYLEGAVDERSAIKRIEADGKVSRECLIKLGGTMERRSSHPKSR